jgi:hypothetical protein
MLNKKVSFNIFKKDLVALVWGVWLLMCSQHRLAINPASPGLRPDVIIFQ